MPVIHLNTTADPRLAPYRSVRDADLLRRSALFLAEGREVVRILLSQSRFSPHSVLLTPVAHAAVAASLAPHPDLPVYILPQEEMNSLVGFDIHRGCLAAVHRGPDLDPVSLLTTSRRLLILESLTNHDNVGGLFRNAAAFGVDAVLLSPDCCDPLYRKAIRVSMGGALRVPFARFAAADWPHRALLLLRERSIHTLALTPSAKLSISDSSARPLLAGRIALLLGAEGPGLSDAALAAADTPLRINISPGIDSINVSAAAAIALHHLFDAGTLTP